MFKINYHTWASPRPNVYDGLAIRSQILYIQKTNLKKRREMKESASLGNIGHIFVNEILNWNG